MDHFAVVDHELTSLRQKTSSASSQNSNKPSCNTHLPFTKPSSSGASNSSEPLLGSKECDELICEYFHGRNVHGYFTCPSKLCSCLSQGELDRLKEQKKFLHSWLQEKENWWLCMVGDGMYCLLCKKHGVKTSQNKDETAFTHTHTKFEDEV